MTSKKGNSKILKDFKNRFLNDFYTKCISQKESNNKSTKYKFNH